MKILFWLNDDVHPIEYLFYYPLIGNAAFYSYMHFTRHKCFNFCEFQTVNIPDAYADLRFDASVDEDTGFKHNTILCMAIKNSDGMIIGVIQVSVC